MLSIKFKEFKNQNQTFSNNNNTNNSKSAMESILSENEIALCWGGEHFTI